MTQVSTISHISSAGTIWRNGFLQSSLAETSSFNKFCSKTITANNNISLFESQSKQNGTLTLKHCVLSQSLYFIDLLNRLFSLLTLCNQGVNKSSENLEKSHDKLEVQVLSLQNQIKDSEKTRNELIADFNQRIDIICENTVDTRIVKALRKKVDIATQIMGEELKEWI